MAGSSQQMELELQVRRAHAGDVQRISSLIGQQHDAFKQQFGSLPVRQLVETAFLTLVAEAHGSVVAFASMTDLPAVQNLDATVAVDYMKYMQPKMPISVSTIHGLLPDGACGAQARGGKCGS